MKHNFLSFLTSKRVLFLKGQISKWMGCGTNCTILVFTKDVSCFHVMNLFLESIFNRASKPHVGLYPLIRSCSSGLSACECCLSVSKAVKIRGKNYSSWKKSKDDMLSAQTGQWELQHQRLGNNQYQLHYNQCGTTSTKNIFQNSLGVSLETVL